MMALDKSLKVSGITYDELDEFKTEREHSSFDSAIRELLREVSDE